MPDDKYILEFGSDRFRVSIAGNTANISWINKPADSSGFTMTSSLPQPPSKEAIEQAIKAYRDEVDPVTGQLPD